MKLLTKLIAPLALVVLLALPALANEQAHQQAVDAALRWLKVIDTEQYDQSWSLASESVKGAVTKEHWTQSISGARKLFRPVVSRTVLSKHYATSLPGAPDGEYVVIQFKTSFKNKKSAVETVTPKRDPNGSWRVSGYYIR